MTNGNENKEGVCARSAMNKHRFRLFAGKSMCLALILATAPLISIVNNTEAANLQFTANVTPGNECSITVIRDGDLGVSADTKTLSSKIAGGLSGIANVRSTGNYDLYADAPGGFTTAPAGGNANTTFEARFSGVDVFRGRTFAEQSGTTPVRLRNGLSITRVNVHLIATRTLTEFPGGNYTGFVTVRCE